MRGGERGGDGQAETGAAGRAGASTGGVSASEPIEGPREELGVEVSPMAPTRKLAIITALGGAFVALAACTGPPPTTNPTPSPSSAAPGMAEGPVATTDADWAGVRTALGRAGTLSGTVYRVSLPRSDLAVTSQGVALKPGLALGGYLAFTRYPDTTLVMGDLVVTEAELPALTDALQAGGIEQTAVHKHLLAQEPPVWWTHVHAMGDPVQLARALAAGLHTTATPMPAPMASQPPVELDTAGIDTALAARGPPTAASTSSASPALTPSPTRATACPPASV